MENPRLKVFRTVAELLSFHRAAEQLGLTQPAVTLHIKALENELSIRLLDRTGNKVSLTPAGKILYRHATAIAEIVSTAEKEIAEAAGDHAGELHVGASTSIAQYVLPKLLGLFHQKFPRVRLSVVSGNTEEIVDHLLAQKIDIGLIEGPALRRDVKTEPFLADELVLIVPAKHAWTNGTDVTIEDLKNAPLLLREHGSGTRRVLEMALEKVGLKKPFAASRLAASRRRASPDSAFRATSASSILPDRGRAAPREPSANSFWNTATPSRLKTNPPNYQSASSGRQPVSGESLREFGLEQAARSLRFPNR